MPDIAKAVASAIDRLHPRRTAVIKAAVQTSPSAQVDGLALSPKARWQANPVSDRPLDPRFWQLGADVTPAARAEWQRYLQESGGNPSFVPIGKYDPGRPAVVVVPGIGMNFQDVHALQGLQDKYQVLIVVSDYKHPGEQNIRQDTRVLTALDALAVHRDRLAATQGVSADRSLRIVAHSYGNFLSTMALSNLAKEGHLGPGKAYDKATFVGLDAPWGGMDVPRFMTTKPALAVLSRIVDKLPGHDPAGGIALLNGTPTMNAWSHVELPGVKVQIGTVIDPPPGPPKPHGLMGKVENFFTSRFPNPVNDWYTQELGRGDLGMYWSYMRDGARDPKLLQGKIFGVIPKQRVTHLYHGLTLDQDMAAHQQEFIDAAKRAKTAQDYGPAWNHLVGNVVNTFVGEHTSSMWTDPTFMPWVRKNLAGS